MIIQAKKVTIIFPVDRLITDLLPSVTPGMQASDIESISMDGSFVTVHRIPIVLTVNEIERYSYSFSKAELVETILSDYIPTIAPAHIENWIISGTDIHVILKETTLLIEQ